jgi:phosphatidate cytidylyltransferase
MSAAPAKPVRFGDLGLRLASGLALAALALVDIWLGGWWLGALAALAAALMLWEFHRMVTGVGRIGAPALVAAVAAAVAAVAATALEGLPAGAAAILLGLVAVLALARGAERPWLAGGLVYIGLAMCFLSMLRDSAPLGLPAVLWLVLVVVAADVGAYFAGRSFGGPRLWPAVSPGKTWSGALGGLGLAVAVGVGFGHASGWALGRTGLLSAAVAVASQAGDLLESAVKRRFGVKDTSRLIPGHGGLLDRLDGVMGAIWFFALYDLAGGGFGA